MTALEFRDLTPEFVAEVHGFTASALDDLEAVEALRERFDRRAILVFRDLDLGHPGQVRLSQLVIGEIDGTGAAAGADAEPAEPAEPAESAADDYYVSNRREGAAAPFGRLQYHSDTMWAAQPIQVLSLYGLEVGAPVAPTTFVSTTDAWSTLPADLRARAEAHSVLHSADGFRRGDLTDVFVSSTTNPRSVVTPIGWRHPRTGETMLYVCEQMTKEVVGLDPDDSEALLQELFAHLYDPAREWTHEWRERDLVIWDNLAAQHARHVSVQIDGPPRTLRKTARPTIQLRPDEVPTYRPGRGTAPV